MLMIFLIWIQTNYAKQLQSLEIYYTKKKKKKTYKFAEKKQCIWNQSFKMEINWEDIRSFQHKNYQYL